MSIQLNKNDQKTVITLGKKFINHYYTSLNSRNFDNIAKLLKPFSIFSFEKQRKKGHEIIQFLKNIALTRDTKYHVEETGFDVTHSGARKINILVTGKFSYIENEQRITKNFAEYIHFGQANNKQFWIQVAMFKIIP